MVKTVKTVKTEKLHFLFSLTKHFNDIMFIKNIKEEFFNTVYQQKALIFVNYDVDAICSLKIIFKLFTNECVFSTVIPVITTKDMKNAYDEHSKNLKFALFLNCGGTVDLVELLQPNENVTLFVMDSHRPTDPSNIYVNQQVKLLYEEDPKAEDIFIDSDSKDDDKHKEETLVGDEEGSLRKKRQRLDDALEKQRQHDEIMFEYTKFSYYARSSAILMYELAYKLDKGNSVDFLWWGIVGMTEQYILNKVDTMHYVNEVEKIADHVGRLCYVSETMSRQDSSTNMTERIIFEQDLKLALYRHWTIEACIKFSISTAVALKLWKMKGESTLQDLLLDIGVTLNKSKKKFTTLESKFRQEFSTRIKNCLNSKNIEITYPSFTLCYGFGNNFQAADYVYSLSAILLGDQTEKSFLEAVNSLERKNDTLLLDGIEKSKKFIECTLKQVQNVILRKQLVSAGPFLYFTIDEEEDGAEYYSKADSLSFLATFTLRAYVTTNEESFALPLLASAPLTNGDCLIVGIPPVAESIPRSFFGQAFLKVAQQLDCNVYNEYFDSTVVRISMADRQKFFDKLAQILNEECRLQQSQ